MLGALRLSGPRITPSTAILSNAKTAPGRMRDKIAATNAVVIVPIAVANVLVY